MGCFCAGGLNLDGNHDHHMSGLLDDLSDLNLDDDLKADVSLCRNSYVMKSHRVDLLIDPPCYVRDLQTDGNSDGNLYRHMNVMDDRNDLMMVVNHVNRRTGVHLNAQLVYEHRVDLMIDPECYVRHDRMTDGTTDGTTDGNLYRHTNVMGDRNDLKMDGTTDVSRANRNCVRRDRKMDGNLYPRMNVTDDRKMDGNHVNRNCAPRDRRMDVNLDGMNLHVMLMVCLNKSCDRMSHDHLRCDHQMMRHHDTNRMGGQNLDVKNLKTDDPMNLSRVIRQMKVGPKTDDRKMI